MTTESKLELSDEPRGNLRVAVICLGEELEDITKYLQLSPFVHSSIGTDGIAITTHSTHQPLSELIGQIRYSDVLVLISMLNEQRLLELLTILGLTINQSLVLTLLIGDASEVTDAIIQQTDSILLIDPHLAAENLPRIIKHAVVDPLAVVTTVNLICVDYADYSVRFDDSQINYVSFGCASGAGKAEKALEQALYNPLLGQPDQLRNASGIFVVITTYNHLSIEEFNAIGSSLAEEIDNSEERVIISVLSPDPTYPDDYLTVSIIAASPKTIIDPFKRTKYTRPWVCPSPLSHRIQPVIHPLSSPPIN